jgi:protein ImuA
MSRFTPSLSALRQRIALIDPVPAAKAGGVFSLGDAVVDARLGGGLGSGLARATLHEVFAGEEEDAGAAAAFALILALRGGDMKKPILWVRDDRAERNVGRIYGLGLIALGADPKRFILVHAPDELATLRAAADSVKCGAVGAVMIEPYGKAPALDLTASRRLALAAASSGVLTLVLRVGAEPSASAAQTRWSVKTGPSAPLAANATGHVHLNVSLLRHRSGVAGFEACLEWNREQQICVLQHPAVEALSGGVSAAALFGTDHAKTA